MGGSLVDLVLTGPDAQIRGTLRTTVAASVSQTSLRGSYAPNTTTLSLTEHDVPHAARFELQLDQDHLEGQVIKPTGARGPIKLVRR